MTLDPIIPENYCRFFVKLKLHIMMLSLLRPCEPKHEYYVKFLSIVNPGLEVWSGTYANAKPDTTNRSIFFLLCADAGLKAQFGTLVKQ